MSVDPKSNTEDRTGTAPVTNGASKTPFQEAAEKRREIVLQEFEEPEDKSLFAHRCSTVNNQPIIFVRGTDVQRINENEARHTADSAKRTLAPYATAGLEPLGGAYPVDPETGNIANLTQQTKVGQKQPSILYERRFRINASLL